MNTNSIIQYMRKNWVNAILIAFVAAMLFVPEAKAYVNQGLMKIGLFQPDLSTDKLEKLNESVAATNGDEPTYRFTAVDKNGKKITLEELKGKVVFINYWATWCPPCIAEMPSIQTLYDKYKGKEDVAFLIVEIENRKDKALKFMEKKNLDLPVFFPEGKIPTEFFKGSLPTTVMLDKKGNIAHITEGMADYSGQDVVDFIEMLREMK